MRSMENDREWEKENWGGGNGCTDKILCNFEERHDDKWNDKKIKISLTIDEEIQRRPFICYEHMRTMEENSKNHYSVQTTCINKRGR